MRFFLFFVFFLTCPPLWGSVDTPGNVDTTQRDRASGVLFHLSGSNTIGAKLSPLLCKAFLEKRGATQVVIAGTSVENEYLVGGVHQGKAVSIHVAAHGSSTGFKALKAGAADIAMASRPIKESERQALLHLGDLLSYSAEHVVAIDGLAIIVHPENPLNSLSLAEIAKIFSGKVTNWKQLGGDDKSISVLARDNESGTWDTFKSLVLGGSDKLVVGAQRFESNDKLALGVFEGLGAIGFVALSAVNRVKALGIAVTEVTSIEPSEILVATEDYPLSRRLFLYTAEKPTRPYIADFIDFVQSDSGQALVQQVGFVSQEPFGIAAPVDSGPDLYQAISMHAERLSVNFRFMPHSAQLDNKAKRDAHRLAVFLKRQKMTSLVQLIGFSEPKNTGTLTEVLSKLRASAVKRALFDQGVYVEPVQGFGAQLPVAESGTSAQRNNRVEVWVYTQEQAKRIDDEMMKITQRRQLKTTQVHSL